LVVAKGGVITGFKNGSWVALASGVSGIQQVEFLEASDDGNVYVADGDVLVKIMTNGIMKSYALSNSTLTTNDIKKVITATTGESYALDLNGKIHQMAPTWNEMPSAVWNQNSKGNMA
jgi:hypothetical protein